MSDGATAANHTANQNYTNWETSALGNYNNDIGAYNSNVNAQLAQGNPYESQAYLTQQNIATSGAMNSANTAAATALKQNAARTGQNSAAVGATIANNARQGQMDLTNYNATRDTQNEDKYLTYEQQLTQDQLAGANSQAGVFGTEVGGDDNSLTNLTNEQDAEDQMWGQIAGGVTGAAGAALSA